ncbi:cupredoxin domain-containing protein [Candidatus Nomurabacteria bacterium]|nr:cupredoxin domain-containing protein [Candidatus Nomurabacteria bacterium]
MKKTFIWVVVLVLIVLGIILFLGKGSKLEAPTTENQTETNEQDMGAMDAFALPSDYNVPVENTSAPVKEFIVDGKNFSFTPNMITVKKGDLVKITFKNTAGFHDLVINEFKVATKQIRTGEEETISFIADKVGSFIYYCSVGTHRAQGMWGTLKVE